MKYSNVNFCRYTSFIRSRSHFVVKAGRILIRLAVLCRDGCTALLLLAGLSSAGYSQIPQVKWHYDLNDMSFGQSASADLDGDGKPEIVFGTYRNDGKVYALNAEDGSLFWQYNTGGCNDAGPTIFDVDGDGQLEVIVASSCVPATFCLNGQTGALKWQTPTHGSDSPPTIGDVDHDGKPEILHGEFDGYVICINGEDGSVAWEICVDPNSWIQTEPALLDLDGDGQLDFVVGNWSFGTNNIINAYRGDNHQLLWSVNTPTDVMYHGAAFADIDLDGKPELAIGAYDGTLYVLNGEDGSTCFTYPLGSSYYAGAPTSIADLNNDGFPEVAFFGWYKLTVVSHTGSLVWTYNLPDYASSFRGAAISDINGDGYPDLVFGTSEGKLIGVRGNNGSPIFTLDLAAIYGNAFEIDHGPVISDFDGDGQLEAFIVGGHAEYPNIQNNYGCAYAVSVGTGPGPAWPMFRRDIVRSSCLCDNLFTSLPGNTGTSGEIEVYPNPFSAEATILIPGSVALAGTVYISDIRGLSVITLPTAPGRTEIKWDGKNDEGDLVSPGVYFFSLVTKSGASHGKAAIMRR